MKHNILKKQLKSILFILIGFFLFLILHQLFIPKWYYPNRTLKEQTARILTGIYDEPKGTIDIAFLGTSHMIYGVAPMELYEKHGIKSYNLSTPSQPLHVSYYLFKNLLKEQKPKLLVYDASSLFTERCWELSWRYVLDYMPFSINKYEAAREFTNNFNDITLLEALSPIYNYHSRWASLEKIDFTDFRRNNHLYTKGGVLNSEQIPAPTVNEMNASAPPAFISVDMVNWLLKLKTLCEENDVELLVTKVPSIQLPAVYDSAWTRPRSDEVRRICEEKDIPFFDILYDMHNPINPTTDFLDGGRHMNFLGTQKVSNILGDYLVNHYTLDTTRLPMWDKDLQTYQKVRNVALLQLDFQFESYLSRLKDCFSDKTIFISASDEMSSALSDKEKERLKALGLQTNFSDCYRKSYLAVIENGTVIYETSSDDKLSYSSEITGTNIPYSLVSSNYNTGSCAEIVINNTNYARNTRGFNIVVYDTDTQMVLDSVSFDTFDPAHTVNRDNTSTLQYLQEFEYFMIENKKP